MTRLTCIRVLLAAAIMAGVSTGAQAQNTGSIRGVVTDPTGAVVPGATVVISSDALIGRTREATTSELGVYRFPSVPVGIYVVDVNLPGFSPVKIGEVSVSLGGTASVDVTLQLAATAETVSVVGESPVVDVTTSTVAANIKGELLEEVPTRRNMYDLIQVQAGMSVDLGDGQSDRVVAFGSNRQSNSWNIDGVEVSGPETGSSWWEVNPDVIEEIQVLGVGAPAEYGNHTGGVFNVVTKSGSNIFHGAASYFVQTDALTGVNVELPDSDFTFHRERYANVTAQLGGPLIRDRTWFFSSWEYERDASTEPGNDPSFAPEVYSDNFDIKVTTRLGQKHDLNGFVHYERGGSPEIPSPFITPSALSGEYTHNPAWGGGWQTAVSDRLLLDFRYAGWWSDDVYKSQTGSIEEPFIDYTPPGGGPTTESGGVDYTWDYVTWREQAKAKATYYAQNFLKSQHEFKMGLQYSKGSAKTNLGIGPQGSYMYSYYGTLYRVVQDPYQYGGVNQDVGVFVDDNVTIGDRLTLNLGVRYDHNTGEIPDYERLTVGTPSISPSGNFKATGETIPGAEVVNWNLVSPRLGFAYKAAADGRSVIRGSFGIYYDHNVIGNWDVPAPGRPARHFFFVDPVTLENLEEFNTIGEGQISISPDLKPPKTYQYAVGFEQQLLGTLALGVQYVYKTTSDLVGWEILGGVYEPFPFTDPFTGRVYTLQSEVENPVIRKGNDPGTFPGAEGLDYFQHYHGVVFSFNRRYSNNWGLSGSYTWSRSEGLIPRMLAQAQFNPFYGSTEGSDPNHFVNAEGRLQGDRPHMFRIQSVVMLPYEIQLATGSEFSTGRAFNRQISVGGLGQGRRSVIMEPGGSHRFPAIRNVDVSFGKRVNLNGRLQLRLEAWVFNALNSDQSLNFADLRLQSPEDDFVADTWVKPRALQFRVGFQF